MEKLEGEKMQIEQQNQLLQSRLSQMEVENNRLNQQVVQLSAEVHGSRSASPKPATPATESPTLTPTLFKQEGDELPLERVPFPTPSVTDYSPTLKPSTLAESSDATQHPAAMLCDLQCPSPDSKELEAPSLSLTSAPAPAQNLMLQTTLQLLFLTMTSTAFSTVIRPLSLILQSLKMGSPLEFSTAEIYQHFPLILWLISTPTLSPSRASSRPTVFRMRLLARLLACSPALARPLRDATGRALQLALSDSLPRGHPAAADGLAGRQNWESLLTMAWVIDCLDNHHNKKPGHHRRQRFHGLKLAQEGRRIGKSLRNQRSSRRSNGTLSSRLMGKDI